MENFGGVITCGNGSEKKYLGVNLVMVEGGDSGLDAVTSVCISFC